MSNTENTKFDQLLRLAVGIRLKFERKKVNANKKF